MRAVVDGKLPPGVTAKDIILAIIGEIGMAGGTGHVHRICRRGDPRALDGRPHDGLQHVDRGRRARRHDRAGREDLRIPQGPPQGAEGRRVGNRDALLGDAAFRRGRGVRPRDQARCREAPADRHLGHEPRAGGLDHRPRADARGSDRRAQARDAARARSPTWTSRAARRSPTSRSTACSSAHAPTAASRICARSRGSPKARRSMPSVYAMIVPGSGIVKEQAEAEGPRQDLQGGGLRLARAGLLDVPCDESRQAQRPASAAPRPRTAISKAGRATRAARISSRPRWRRRPRSRASSSTCASGNSASARTRPLELSPARIRRTRTGRCRRRRPAGDSRSRTDSRSKNDTGYP